MTIESALQSIYPDRIIGEPVNLGMKLYLTMNNNDLARNWISYLVTRGGAQMRLFSSSTLVAVCTFTRV